MKDIKITKCPALEYAGTEAFNTLATNLMLCGANMRVIMVTSCQSGEGKSMTALNLARTIAGLGHNVALVDTDLRRSKMIAQYGITGLESEKSLGLVHYLASMAEPRDVLYRTNIEGLFMVPVGRTVTNSLTLLNNTRMSELFTYLLNYMDYIIVDAPPVGMIVDAVEVSRYCDGTLMVVGYNTVHRRELVEACQQIKRGGCPILGVSLNNVEMGTLSNKKYYNKSYYQYYKPGYYRAEGTPHDEPRKKRTEVK